VTNVFLSHKQSCGDLAEALMVALNKVVPDARIFRAEAIEKSDDYRVTINSALKDAKCFILLYTDPALDWSWCFYEAGSFVTMGRGARRVYCLHPLTVPPPSPIANLQTIRAEQEDIVQWIGDFCRVLHCKAEHNEDKLRATARTIGRLVNEAGPLQEEPLKPYIWIEPKWDGDWNDPDKIPKKINFSNASVSIDKCSAARLGVPMVPKLTLLSFLRMIACDSRDKNGKLEFWIEKFFDSLREAAEGISNLQEAAFFRHKDGRIFRPVVVSNAKNASGTRCRLRVIFASTFGSPLVDSPGRVQRLAVGTRLAVRTRLEVLEPFLGRTSQIYKDTVQSRRAGDEVSPPSPVGGRIVEALNAIWLEAISHGVREGKVPKLFNGPDQKTYENLRGRGFKNWEAIKKAAPSEDAAGTGSYPETERLLADLKQINQDYLAIVLPRIEELLLPAEKKHDNGD
jgi:hypothetical protein